MKNVRYGRLVVTLLLAAYSLWVIFGNRVQRETPYDRRVRQLEDQIAQLPEDDPDLPQMKDELEELRQEARRNRPPALRERATALQQQLAAATEGTEEHRRLEAELQSVKGRIPAWYETLPINLGLDLRGGTEVRMRIVSERLERRRLALVEQRETLEDELAGLPEDDPAREETEASLKQTQADLADVESSLESNIQDAVEVIRNRLDRQGMSSIQATREGQNRIRVELPGMDASTAQSVVDTIRTAGRLEFRLVVSRDEEPQTFERFDEIRDELDPNSYDICLKHGRPLAPGEITPGGLCKQHHTPLYDWLRKPAVVAPDGTVTEESRMYLVEQEEDPLTGRHIRLARASMDPRSPGKWQIELTFDLEGTKRFARLTRDNEGRQLAIILDNKLKSAPNINEPITGGRATITGNFTQTEARNLALILKEGSLPVDLEVEMENNVGATLGEDSIRHGMSAIVTGLVLVFVFVSAYYLVAGLVASLALLLNMLFILTIFISFGAVLTLPGIAGLILTVGMAVDANVLIFERIREELRKGQALGRAIANGYDRAFVTIVDANATTFITALILLTFGTAAVKGFAIALTIGILTSMFVALFVTRGIFHVLLDMRVLSQLRMLEAIRTPRIDFIQASRKVAPVSVVLIVLGLALFFSQGEAMYAHDFTGGVLAQPNFREPVEMNEARTKLDALRKSIRTRIEASVRQETGDEAFALPAGAIDEIGLQGTGQPAGPNAYRSIIFRTKPVHLDVGDEATEGAELDAAGGAEAFRTAFREAITEVYPVAPDGLAKPAPVRIPAEGSLTEPLTLEGMPAWEFTLNLDTPKPVPEVQKLLSATALKHVFVRPVGTEAPAFQGTRARVTVAVEPDYGLEEEGLEETTLEEGLRHVLDELGADWLAEEAALTGVKLGDGEAPEGRKLVTATLALGRPMSADQLKDELLASDLLTRAEVDLLDTEAPALPEESEPRRHVAVICTIPVTAQTEDEPAAQEQFIRRQVSSLRGTGLDYSESFDRFTSVGPVVAGEMKQKAVLALLYSMVAIFFYIWLRFQFRASFGIGACLALAHDVLFTIGALAVAQTYFNLGVQIDLPIVAALLTIVGYSLNDTIVVFDRIRENMHTGGASLAELVNTSINQTLSRTLLTSLTTLLVVLSLLILGGDVIRGFAFALLIGVLVGTYSSVFIASPVLVALDALAKRRREEKTAAAQTA
jgi:SecD/SecF fusion protein